MNSPKGVEAEIGESPTQSFEGKPKESSLKSNMGWQLFLKWLFGRTKVPAINRWVADQLKVM